MNTKLTPRELMHLRAIRTLCAKRTDFWVEWSTLALWLREHDDAPVYAFSLMNLIEKGYIRRDVAEDGVVSYAPCPVDGWQGRNAWSNEGERS